MRTDFGKVDLGMVREGRGRGEKDRWSGGVREVRISGKDKSLRAKDRVSDLFLTMYDRERSWIMALIEVQSEQKKLSSEGEG